MLMIHFLSSQYLSAFEIRLKNSSLQLLISDPSNIWEPIELSFQIQET